MAAENTNDTRTAGPASWDAGLYDERHAFVWKHGASLVELLAPQSGERILDLGCGTGHLTARIAASGARVVGLDASEEMLAQARATYPDLEFRTGDARDFTVEAPFAAVFSNATLHWVRPPEAAVQRMRAALEPGGRFVAEFGGRGNVRLICQAAQAALERLRLPIPEFPWYFPGIAEYATLLEAEGLEVRFATLFDRPTPLEGEQGLRNWIRMFGGRFLDAAPLLQQEEFFSLVEEMTRPDLFQGGIWKADYRRLRIVAVALG
jgi:trans-aconitate methyltransferase